MLPPINVTTCISTSRNIQLLYETTEENKKII